MSGATYANVTVVGPGHDEIVAVLADSPALVSETIDGMTVVFAAADEEAHQFGEGITAARLSAAGHGDALEVSVYDDSILQYRLFRHGEEIDVGVVATPAAVELARIAGGSLPEADPARLVRRLGRGNESLARKALAAGEPFDFASERHVWLVEALDLPRCAPGWGYRYLTSFPDSFDGGPLTPVGSGPEEAT